MDKVRIFALGGLDENGKNMYCVEINDVIFVVEAGIMIPDTTVLGVEFIIPDFTYLIENKERIGGIFITHAHDDVMRALPFLLKQIDVPVYTGKFTSLLLEDYFRKEHVKHYDMRIIKRTDSLMIRGIKVRTFAMTHAVPDNFGIAFRSDQGYIVYAGEYVFDYNMLQKEYTCDLNELSEIGKEGVLCLLTESVQVETNGHTAPRHRISNFLEPIFESHITNRFVVAVYKQSLFRIMEVLDLAKKFNKKVFFHDDNLRRILAQLSDLGYYTFPNELIIEKKDFNNDIEDVLIMVSGMGKRLFLKMSNMATQEDNLVQFNKNDTIIVAAPIINGTEKEAVNMENEIYKEGGKIYSLDKRSVKSMHPSQEDLKMALYLFKPKYYFPVKGEYRHLIKNADIATAMGYTPDRIVICDNGQVATFQKKALISMSAELDLDDTMIDGNENWDVTGVVLKDREILSKDGVMIVGVALNYRTKEIISGIDVQTRGLIYLKDSDYIVKEVSHIMEETILAAVSESRYDNIEVRMEARDRINRYLSKETGKRPMVLPVIIEMNV